MSVTKIPNIFSISKDGCNIKIMNGIIEWCAPANSLAIFCPKPITENIAKNYVKEENAEDVVKLVDMANCDIAGVNNSIGLYPSEFGFETKEELIAYIETAIGQTMKTTEVCCDTPQNILYTDDKSDPLVTIQK